MIKRKYILRGFKNIFMVEVSFIDSSFSDSTSLMTASKLFLVISNIINGVDDYNKHFKKRSNPISDYIVKIHESYKLEDISDTLAVEVL